MSQVCYLGIDGGGTKTVGVAMDENGRVLCRATEASINYCSVGMDAAVSALSRITSALIASAGCPAAGLAVGSSALDERIRDGLYRDFLSRIEEDETLSQIPDRVVTSDAYMALLALSSDERGAVLIAGTGMMGLAADGGHLHSVGGWGDVFGDAGSGYWIGRAGLCAALDYTDGLKPEGEALFYAMCEFYGLTSAAELLATVYAPDFDKSKIAAFAECVAALAEKKDLASLAILDGAAEHLCRYCLSLGEFLGPRPFLLGFYGSVLTKNRYVQKAVIRALQEKLPQATVCLPTLSAEDAAAQFSIRRNTK